MFGVTGLFSLLHLPALLHGARKQQRSSGMAVVPAGALLWLFAGSLLLAVQALGMYSAIGLYGSAALTNILYGSRCLWGVLLVWLLAPLVPDRPVGGDRSTVMFRRLLGALLLLSAMALVLR